jgi:hypothetical protein
MGISNRKRRRPIGGRKTMVDFKTIIVIIGVAALLGYGTAKFIIYPFFDDTQPHFEISKVFTYFLDSRKATKEQEDSGTENQENNGIVEDQLNITTQSAATVGSITPESSTTGANIQVAPVQGGYCIQFGSFSTRLGAENLLAQLNNSGITAEIVEKEGAFKVISQLFEQKEQAIESMSVLQGTQFTDAFVTQR